MEVRCGRRATKARPHYKPPRRRPRKHSPTSQGHIVSPKYAQLLRVSFREIQGIDILTSVSPRAFSIYRPFFRGRTGSADFCR